MALRTAGGNLREGGLQPARVFSPASPRLTRRQWLWMAAARATPLNVLFIAADDLRPKMRCYGDPYARTPHMDRLAAGGMLFERAYCQQAVCAPSRASLLTGLRPDTTRVYDLKTTFRQAVPDAVTLPQCFMSRGYHAESIGKIFHGDEKTLDHVSWSVPEKFPILLKRDQYVLEKNKDDKDPWKKTSAVERADVPDDAYRDGQIAAAAVEALERLRKRPFFLAVGFNKPHLPFAAPSRYWDLYKRPDLPLPPNPAEPDGAPPYAVPSYSELRSYGDFPGQGPMPREKVLEAIHGYYAATSYTDAQVGKVLSTLARLGLDSRTVVVLWGDHGWHLGEHSHWGKLTNFEVCVRSPLLLRVPGYPAGRRTGRLVEFVDIYPTLADACGLPVPTGLEGISMMPLLKDPRRPWKKAAFSQFPRGAQKGAGSAMGYSLRTERHRYTEWIQPDGRVAAAELYDHAIDPHETANVVNDPARREVARELAALRHAGWRAALPPGGPV